MTEYEIFDKDRGWEFKTEETKQAAYDRLCKCKMGMLISEDEFIAEATCRVQRDTDTLKAVYAKLEGFVSGGKIKAGEVYRFAKYGWCLSCPEAITAYQTDNDKWTVNNCDEVISENDALVRINRLWGFEVGRIKLIGTPYYCASDWQFIRFDCAAMGWLYAEGTLHQVWE